MDQIRIAAMKGGKTPGATETVTKATTEGDDEATQEDYVIQNILYIFFP